MDYIDENRMSRRTPPVSKMDEKPRESNVISSNAGSGSAGGGGGGGGTGTTVSTTAGNGTNNLTASSSNSSNGGPASPRVTLRLPQVPRTPDKTHQRVNEKYEN